MLHLTSLGRLELTSDGVALLSGRRKLLAVLVYLARVAHPVTRSRLADLFWPVEDEVRARRSVRQAFTEFRRALGEALYEEHEQVGIRTGLLCLDAAELEAAVARHDYQRAAELWGGEFLAGQEDEGGEDFRSWLEVERQVLRRQFAFAAEALADDAEHRRAWEDALAVTARWGDAFPHDERAALRHLRLLALTGRRVEAGARRAAFIERLRTEIGVESSADFQQSTAAVASAGEVNLDSSHGRALLSPDILAREKELAVLGRLWEGVERGASAVALIEGEDGTGKSRLLEEFLRWLSQREPSAVVLRATAFEAERDRNGSVLRHLCAHLASAPGLAASPPGVVKALADLVPEVAERFVSLPPSTPPAALLEAVARALTDVAAEVPVVVALDDAHEADAQSRDVLESLCRHPIDGVLLLLTAVPEQRAALHHLDQRRGDTNGLVKLSLAPFDEATVERMLASMAEFAPSDRRVLAERLYREGGGNPLAVVELAAALADQGVIAPGPEGVWTLGANLGLEPLPLPASLQEANAARLRHLSADAIRVLEAVAVLGRESELGTLREITELDALGLDVALEQLVGGRFLRLSPDGPDRFDVTHETTRQTVYQGMSPLKRQELHRRAWRALRRGPIRDSTRRAALQYHRAHAGTRNRRRGLAAAAITVLALGSLAALVRGTGRSEAPVIEVAGVAITAADSATSSEVAEVAEQLLREILRSTPNIALADPARAKPPATAVAVVGTIRLTQSRVELRASLRRPTQPGPALAQTEATGHVVSLAALAFQVARQLFATRVQMPDRVPYRWASVLTTSATALRAHVTAEQFSRRLEIDAASREYQQALTLDPTFGAAWHGYSTELSRYWADNLAAAAADSAWAHTPLGFPASPEIMDGWRLYAHGFADSAESRFRAALGSAREDPEPNVGLGQVLYHLNWYRGRDPREARPYLEAAARADPWDWRTVNALWELDLRDGRREDAARRRARLSILSTDSTVFDNRYRRLVEDTALFRREFERLAQEHDWFLAGLTFDLTILEHRPDDAARVATELANGAQYATGVKAFGHELLAQLALAGGRWREAQRHIRRASELEPASALTAEALLWATPFLPPTLGADSGRRSMREGLARTAPRQMARTLLGWFDAERVREWIIRPYLTELLALQTGGAVTAGGELRPLPHAPWPDSLTRMRPYLNRSLAARRAAARGDLPAALAILDSAWVGTQYHESHLTRFFARPWDIYLKAGLLERLGRGDEAERWYNTLGTFAIADFIYRAPAQLERGRILERLGRVAEARAAYAEAAELWRDADPELQPMVRMARARLAALGGRPLARPGAR